VVDLGNLRIDWGNLRIDWDSVRAGEGSWNGTWDLNRTSTQKPIEENGSARSNLGLLWSPLNHILDRTVDIPA
jgi:hypothetical protein